jgi:hypothetical protein
LFEIAWLVKKHKKTLECCGLRMLWATWLCFSFAKIWQQASIISLHKEGNFGIPFALISRQTSSKLQKGQRSSDPSIHPPTGRRRGYLILCGEDGDRGRIKGFHKLLHATDQRGAFLVACKVWDYQITFRFEERLLLLRETLLGAHSVLIYFETCSFPERISATLQQQRTDAK